MENDEPIRLGISSCLLGQAVRYDGSHRLDRYITDTLGAVFDFTPYCPEVAIGMGVPRPPIHMVRVDGTLRLRGVSDPTRDVTEAVGAYGEEVAGQCGGFSGYLFKGRSPSCGMEGVEVCSEAGEPLERGPGVFAAAIMRRHPALPVEEEGCLQDPQRRANFIQRVFLYHRWQLYIKAGMDPECLAEFHRRHKFIVLAHDELAYRELGRLVVAAAKGDMETLGRRYIVLLMRAIRQPASAHGHGKVLQQLMGVIQERLDARQRQELLEVIESYRLGRLSLSVPITLLQHYLRRYPNDSLKAQYYLYPDPREWRLSYPG